MGDAFLPPVSVAGLFVERDRPAHPRIQLTSALSLVGYAWANAPHAQPFAAANLCDM